MHTWTKTQVKKKKNTSRSCPFGWHCVGASGFWFTLLCLCDNLPWLWESQQNLVNTPHQPVLLMLACLCHSWHILPLLKTPGGTEKIRDSEQNRQKIRNILDEVMRKRNNCLILTSRIVSPITVQTSSQQLLKLAIVFAMWHHWHCVFQVKHQTVQTDSQHETAGQSLLSF